MKLIPVILIGAVIAGGGYFIFTHSSTFNITNFTAPLKNSGPLASYWNRVKNEFSKLTSAGQQKATDLANQAKETAANTIEDQATKIADSVKQAAVQKAQNALGLPNTSAGAAFNVCPAEHRGESLTFRIENPFSPKSGFNYSAAWGDGTKSSGKAAAVNTNVLVSHAYTTGGMYIITFSFTTASSTATTNRTVCVE